MIQEPTQFLPPDALSTAGHLLGALLAGGVIGLERGYHGRPAGLRTHALVCLASSALMLVTLHQAEWLPGPQADAFRADPTRIAQGIMTGIGFLGAGVIFKHGLNVRGLTTAASIWITAAIGILVGVGLHVEAALATALTLGTLSGFRWIEARVPAHSYARYTVRCERGATLSEDEIRSLVTRHGFTVSDLGYRMTADGLFEYRMTIETADRRSTGRLALAMRELDRVRGFSILPSGD